jgi:O-antigen/teichoic acid export membrane protein
MSIKKFIKMNVITGVLRIFGLPLEFIVIIIMVKNMSMINYGDFISSYALIRVVAVFAQLGFPSIAVRYTAQYVSQSKWDCLTGFIKKASQIIFIASIISIIFYSIVDYFLLNKNKNIEELIIVLLIPLLAYNNLRSAILRGFKKMVVGQFPDQILRPIVIISLIHFYAIINDRKIEFIEMGIILIISYGFTYLIGNYFLNKYINKNKPTGEKFHTEKWIKAAWPAMVAMFVMSLNMQLPLIYLKYTQSNEVVAIYAVVSQLSLSMLIALTVLNIAVAPYISEWSEQSKYKEIHNIMGNGRIVLILINAIGLVVFNFMGVEIIKIFFGGEFIGGVDGLKILATANLIGSLSGMAMIYLNMTGGEVKVMNSQIFSLISLMVSLALIQSFDSIINVALSVSISILVLNFSLAYYYLLSINKKI